jgi:hypothetical protein
VEDPTTIALNLTFFGTLAVAFAMFLGLFGAFVLTLVIAGVGRLVAATAMAIAGGVARVAGTAAGAEDDGTPSSSPQPSKRPSPVRPGRKGASQLSADWTAAVARADARAAQPAQTEAEPAVAAAAREAPSPPAPAAKSPLATGSQAPPRGRMPSGPAKRPALSRDRKAS